MKIFVASTGRCGTVFMAEVFSQLTDYPSFHETVPYCAGDSMRSVNGGAVGPWPAHVRKELSAKIKQVREDTVEGKYFESSQMFIKTYAPMMFKAFGPIGVIYLHRNPIEVTMSYYKKKLGQPRQFNSWHLQSQWRNNILRRSEKQGFYADVYWQCLEIQERFNAIKGSAAKTFVMDFKSLNSPMVWKRLFSHFGVAHKPFEALPEVNKNAMAGDKLKTLTGLLSVWDDPGEWPETEQPEYERLDTYIDFGQKAIAKNQREKNANELR